MKRIIVTVGPAIFNNDRVSLEGIVTLTILGKIILEF